MMALSSLLNYAITLVEIKYRPELWIRISLREKQPRITLIDTDF